MDANRTNWEEPDHILGRFRSTWKQGRRPSLNRYLRNHRRRPDFDELAFKMACLDLSNRVTSGDEPPLVEPIVAALKEEGVALGHECLEELVRLEYQRRWERGDRGVSRGEYAGRFLELAGAIERWRPLWDCPTCPEEQTELPDEKDETAVCPGCGKAFATDSLFNRVSEEFASGLDLRHYVLSDKAVGKGGMGEVFRARDPALRRDLALKMIRADLPREEKAEAERRFLNEARILGILQHPNIVPIHNLGRLPGGRLFFTMKLITGKQLDEKIRDNDEKFRPVFVFEQVCQAVAYAHKRGVIHRDLKPANVLVGEYGEVQVVDWGLAKRLSEGEQTTLTGLPSDAGQTQAGARLGTWWYMPPEQALGEIDKVDKRSDVFALGATLCEILTGCPPHLRPEEMAAKQYQVALARIGKGDISPGRERLKEQKIDSRLVKLVEDCLQKERDQRPADASVVANRIAEYQAQVDREAKDAEIAKAKAEEEKRRAEAELRARQAAEEQQKAEAAARNEAEKRAEAEKIARQEAELREQSETAARQAAEEQQRAESDARREAEKRAKAERGAKRWTRALAGVIFVALIGASGAAYFFNRLADDNQDLAQKKQELYESEQKSLAKEKETATENERLAKQRGEALGKEKAAREVATSRLERQFVQEGARRLAAGDLLGSLPYFAEPLRIRSDSPEKQEVHRLRLAAVMRQAPSLIHVWTHDNEVGQAEFSPDGRYVVTTSDGGPFRVWDADTGRLVSGPIRHEDRQANVGIRSAHVFAAAPPGKVSPSRREQEDPKPLPVIPGPLLRGPDGRVHHAAFDRDGRRLATVSDRPNQWVRVWDVATGKPTVRYMKHPGGDIVYGPCRICFNPDGTRVAACDTGKTVHVWKVASGEAAFGTPLAATAGVSVVLFSPDGSLLLAAGSDGNIRLWDASSGQMVQTIQVSRSGITFAQFSPDGKRILAGSNSESVVAVGDVRSGKLLFQLRHRGRVKHSTFSPDGRRIAIAGRDGTVRVWSADSGTEIGIPLTCEGQPNALAFSPDGRWLAVADLGCVRIFDADFSWEVGPRLVGSGNQVAFSPDGRKLLSASGSVVRMWQVAAEDVPARVSLPVSPGMLGQVASSPDGRWVAVTRPQTKGSPSHLLIDRQAGQVVRPNPLLQRRFHLTATVAARNLWQLLPALYLESDAATFSPGQTKAERVGLSPNGRYLVTFPTFGQVCVWDVTTDRLLSHFHSLGFCHCAAVSPDGKLVACGQGSDSVSIHDSSSGEVVRTLKLDSGGTGDKINRTLKFDSTKVWTGSHLRACLHVEFSQDSQRLLTVNGPWSVSPAPPTFVRLWDVSTGKPVSPAIQPGDQVSHASLSPDGSLIAAPCGDGQAACVWDVKTGEAIIPPMQHRGSVRSSRFSTDGRYVVTAGRWGINNLGAAQLWDARTGEPVTAPFRFPQLALSADFDTKTGQFTALIGGGNLFGGGGAQEVWSWSLRPEKSGEEVIHRRIAALAAARINEAGGYVEADFLAERKKLREAGETQPRPPEGDGGWYERQAVECETEGRWGSAAWHLERHLRHWPKAAWEVHYRCGRAQGNERRWADSIGTLTAAIRLDPPTAEPWRLRGEANASLGHWDPAARDFREVLDRLPTTPGGKISQKETDLRVRLAFIYAAAKKERLYREQCELLLKRLWDNPIPAQIETAAAALLLLPKSVKDSERLVALVKVLQKKHGGPEAESLLALAMYRTDDFQNALQALTRFFQTNPDQESVMWVAANLTHLMLLLKNNPKQLDFGKVEQYLGSTQKGIANAGVTGLGWMQRHYLLPLLREATEALATHKTKQ